MSTCLSKRNGIHPLNPPTMCGKSNRGYSPTPKEIPIKIKDIPPTLEEISIRKVSTISANGQKPHLPPGRVNRVTLNSLVSYLKLNGLFQHN